MNFSSHRAATSSHRKRASTNADALPRSPKKRFPPVRGFTTRKLIRIQAAFTLRSKEGLNLSE